MKPHKVTLTPEELEQYEQSVASPQARAFLRVVNAYHDLGYGRMMQIISHAWYRRLLDTGMPPDSAAIANGAYCLLKDKKRAIYEAMCQSDPLFRDEDVAAEREWTKKADKA